MDCIDFKEMQLHSIPLLLIYHKQKDDDLWATQKIGSIGNLWNLKQCSDKQVFWKEKRNKHAPCIAPIVYFRHDKVDGQDIQAQLVVQSVQFRSYMES